MDVRTTNSVKERSKTEWEQFLLSMQERGVKRFDITGGEPLLRKDLLPIYEELMRRGSQVELITNGTLIDNQNIADKIANSFSQVSISFDSFDSREHDLYRGEGTHKNVVIAMQYLTQAGINWQAKGVLSPDNESSINQTKEFVTELGGHDYVVSIMVGSTVDSDTICKQYYNSFRNSRSSK